MSEEFCTDYKDGDIVWVKLGPSWWPGEVKDLNNIPSEEIEFKKPPLVVVQFFEEDTYEYVRSWSNIYPFNTEKKVDFIKKGMAAFHSKASHMEKFPKDVVAAEVKVGGNSNILSDPAYRIEVKRSYAADNTISPNIKKRSKDTKKIKNQNQRDTSHITHRRFLGCDDYKAYICIQYPGKDRTAGDSEDEEIIRINTEPEQEYNCHSCSYSTKRLEVMILHTKSHIQGHYVSSPKRKRPVVPKARKKENTKKQRPPTLSWSHDSSSDEIAEPPKEKKRKTKTVSSNKAEIAEVKPKKASDICNDLLAEWDDTDDEAGLENTFDVTAASENDETKSESKKVLKNGEDNMDVTENADKDASTEEKETSKSTMDQDTQEAIKSCFDFEEDEEEELINTPTVEGRKIPRVIPPTEKRKSEILEDIIDLEEGINKEEILKVSQSFNERKTENNELENVFKDFMEEVAVPKLPEIKTDLKPTQNFHCVKTIKFPDKLDEPPQKDRDKTEPKLINPKKRFVKSFEDFENQLHKEEIKRKEEELNRKKAKESKVKEIEDDDDSDHIKVDIGRLQCTIMSKIIDEINISDESKQSIMSKLHKKKSPRGKILDSYLSDSASTSKSDEVSTEDISLPGTSKESTEVGTKQFEEEETDLSSKKSEEKIDEDTDNLKLNKKLRKRSFKVEETVVEDDQSKFRKTRHPSTADGIEDKPEANADHPCFDKHKSTTEQTIRKLSFRLSLPEPNLNEKQDGTRKSATTDVDDEKEDRNEKTTRSSRRKTLETDEGEVVESKTVSKRTTRSSTFEIDQMTPENLHDKSINDGTKDNDGSVAKTADNTEAKHDKIDHIDSLSEVEGSTEVEVKTVVSSDETKEILTKDEDKTEPLESQITVGDEFVEDEAATVEQTTDRITRKRTCRKFAIEPEIDEKDDITNDTIEIVDDTHKDEDKTQHKRSSRHASSGKHRFLSAKVTARKRSGRKYFEKHRVEEKDSHDKIEEEAVHLQSSIEEVEDATRQDDEITEKIVRKRGSRHFSTGKHKTDDCSDEISTKDNKNEESFPPETKIEHLTDDKVDETTDKVLRRSSRHSLPVKIDPVVEASGDERLPEEMVKIDQIKDDDKNEDKRRSSQSSSETKMEHSIDDKSLRRRSSRHLLPVKVDPVLQTSETVKHKQTDEDEDNVGRKQSSSSKHRTLKSKVDDEIADDNEVYEKEHSANKKSCKSSSDKKEESTASEIASESNSSQSETKKDNFPEDLQLNMVKDEETAHKNVHRRSSRHSSSEKYRDLNLSVDGIEQKRSSRYSASKSEHLPDEIEAVVAKVDENVKEQIFSSDIDVITTKEEDKTTHKRSTRSGKHRTITDNLFEEVKSVDVEIEQIYCVIETPQASTSISEHLPDEVVTEDDKNDHINVITTEEVYKRSSRHSSSGKHHTKTKVADKIEDDNDKNMGGEEEVSTVDKNEEHVENAVQEHVPDEKEKVVKEDDRFEKIHDEKESVITEDDLAKDKLAISDEIRDDDEKERKVLTFEDNFSKKSKGKFRFLSSKEELVDDNKVEDSKHKINLLEENKVDEETQETSQNASMDEQQGIQVVEKLEAVDKESFDQTIFQYSLVQSSSGIETIDKESVQTNDELPKQESQIDGKKEEEPNLNTKPQTTTTLLEESQTTDGEMIRNKSDLVETLENRQKLRLPFKKGRWSIRTSHPKKYRNIETVSPFRIAEEDKIKTNESPSKDTVEDNVEILTEGISLDKNKIEDESLVSQIDNEKIPSLESVSITEDEVKLAENINEVTVEDVTSLSEEKSTEQDKNSTENIENVDEDNFDLNTSEFSELCSQNEEFSVENTSLELPEYAICEPSTKFDKRKKSRRLPKKIPKENEDLTDEDNNEQFDVETDAKEEIEDENVPIIDNQEVVNDSTIETVEEETIFEVTIEEDSGQNEEKLDETSEKCIEAEESIIGDVIANEEVVIEEQLLDKEEITVPPKDKVSSVEETVSFDPTSTFSFECNKDSVEDFGEYQNLLESSKKSDEDKQSIESKFIDMPADDEDEKLTDLVSDIVQKLNRDESDKNQEVLDMELEEEMRPKSPKTEVKEAVIEPANEDKSKNLDNDEEKVPNEVEIFCASNSNDSFNFCIQTNLSNLSRSEEISAIALATLSEVKTDTTEEIPPKVDLPSPEKLSDTEMAAIEGNLTVMSEKDLADAQVEITSEKVISCKKPVMLSSFSMDFSESSQTTTEPRKYKDIDSKGTEFTSRAITKEFKPKSHTKKMNTYNQCELLNILEGNSDADKKIVEFQTPAKSFTGDICDFEEHIPSQIVCTKQFKQDLDDEFKKKEKSSVISTTSKLLERLTEIKKETPTETATKTIKPKPKLKPIILSEQIIKPASDPKKIIPLSSNVVNDIEDVEAFIIRKDIKKHVEVEETTPAVKPVRKPRQKPLGKANILQQTIITPAGEIIQPATTATLSKMKTVLVNAPAASISTRTPAEIELNKTSKSTEGTNQDDNVFDIFNMPIVLSDQILTPESIENMPIVIENNAPVNKPKPIVQPTKVIPNKAVTKIVTTGKTTIISTKGTNVSAKFTKPKILQTTTKSVTPNILSRSTKPGKYILVSQSSGIAQHPKKTIIKKTSLPASLPTKLSGASEGAGHKIMVVTNQQGQQQRLLLTPAQQKVLGYKPSIGSKVEKPVIKSDILQKSLTTASLKPEIGGIKSSTIQKIVTTAGQVVAGLTTSRSIKPVMKRAPSSPSSQKLTSAKTTKTILITNKHGQTIKKIATTEDDIDKQVAEQLEAIKASSAMHFSSQSKSEPIANKLLQKSPAPKKYNRKQESKFKTIPVSTKSEIPSNPILPLSTPKKIPETKKEEPKPQIDRPLNQLVIQDALGNQTTITEGQILALPSETVDGHPQSYMLVTLDQAGNLTPLNNEALMSLDPNLGLGGDLSNIVLQIDQGALGTGNINQPTPLAQPATVKITNPGEELQAGTSKIDIPRETVPLSLPVANEVPLVEQKIEDNIMIAPEASVNIVSNSNGDQGQQLIVTGDPIATQKFLESLSEGTTDLANIIANAEGKSILIQADGQQILINTNTDSQMLTNVVESTEGDGNPVFATQPSKNTDILAAALADTDVFSTQTKVSSQLSPNNALYPINVSNVLETSLTLNSPIMTPLEVPSSNSKKIPDDVVDILTQVPKNVDLPITITDPNISQTVANQQVATLIGNEFQANLELGLSIPEATITAVSTGLSSPGYNYSLSTLDDNDMTHKPFNSSMPLLNDDVEDGITVKKSDKDDDKNLNAGSFLGEESRFTLGGSMCSSLSEPPPEMFDIPDNPYGEKNGNNIPLSLQSTPDPKDDDGSIQTESSSEGSCEIPLQPTIVAKSADLSEVNDI